jgi:hypothetical protein
MKENAVRSRPVGNDHFDLLVSILLHYGAFISSSSYRVGGQKRSALLTKVALRQGNMDATKTTVLVMAA